MYIGLYSRQILMHLESSRHIFENSHTKFHENPPDFDAPRIFSTYCRKIVTSNFMKIRQILISLNLLDIFSRIVISNFMKILPICAMFLADRWTDGRADIRKVIVVFLYSANAPKIGHKLRLACVIALYSDTALLRHPCS